jgi:hypothetical protein
MDYANKQTMRIGKWIITKYYERYNDFGIERLRVAWWGIRKFYESEKENKFFMNHSKLLDYINQN